MRFEWRTETMVFAIKQKIRKTVKLFQKLLQREGLRAPVQTHVILRKTSWKLIIV